MPQSTSQGTTFRSTFVAGTTPHAWTSRLENKELTVLLETNPTKGRRALHALWTKIVKPHRVGTAL